MDADIEARRAAVNTPVTLDGRPACVAGIKCDFAGVKSLDGKLQGEWAWSTVFRVIAAGGNFKL
jgi:hypothetical protein